MIPLKLRALMRYFPFCKRAWRAHVRKLARVHLVIAPEGHMFYADGYGRAEGKATWAA